MLVTISIAAIMMTLAIPNFMDFLRNNRLAGQANDFVLACAYAKSEAVKRGLRVTICSRQDDATCSGGPTWDAGWLVFVDNDGSGTVNGADEVLQVRAPLEGDNTMRADAIQRIRFQPTGFSSDGDNNDPFRICDTRGMAVARQLVVLPLGRVTSSTGTAECP
ncbi:MAG: GspH/FimT family pseudopilin [Thiobacillus sp.]|nr:GspH/FimT family pseudopilin [Thiobacillus sp.]